MVHSLDLFARIPEEGYLNKIILGVSADGTVAVPAKYFGYGAETVCNRLNILAFFCFECISSNLLNVC